MEPEILSGQPPNPADEALIDAYRQEIVKQAERYDNLAKELIKLELAIPGIYATALKFIVGGQPLSVVWVIVAFVLWLFALLFTLMALFPHEYPVLDNVVRHANRTTHGGPLSIEEYFQKSTQHKRLRLILSALLFFAGIAAAAAAVLIR